MTYDQHKAIRSDISLCCQYNILCSPNFLCGPDSILCELASILWGPSGILCGPNTILCVAQTPHFGPNPSSTHFYSKRTISPKSKHISRNVVFRDSPNPKKGGSGKFWIIQIGDSKSQKSVSREFQIIRFGEPKSPKCGSREFQIIRFGDYELLKIGF